MATDSTVFDRFAETSTSYSASDYINQSHHGANYAKGGFDADAPFQLRRPPLATLITPPDSPARQTSPTSFNFPPFLQRANTVINHRRREPSPNVNTPPASRSNSPAKGAHKARGSVAAFSDMFHGSSAPLSLGILPSPKKELAAGDAGFPGMTDFRPASHRRGNSFQTAASFFGLSSKTNLTGSSRPRAIDEADAEDPFLNLELEDELFPKGVPGADIPSADAYDELIANASRLFLRMQTAYEQKHRSLREYQASKTFEQEELEEARTRAKHLKLQLDGMSAVVAEQSETMNDLEKQLHEEQQRRRLDNQLCQNSIRMVSGHGDSDAGSRADMSAIDLGQLDLSAESDDDEGSQAESVFSQGSRAASTRSSDTRIENGVAAEDMAPWIAPRVGAEQLREENAMLKARVQELEETVNACLGLV